MESFYILQELYQHQPLTKELLEDYFSAGTVKELGNAIAEVELPPLDLINECNELLQDLSVNYQKEGLYQDTLNPILALAEEISEALSDSTGNPNDTKAYESTLLEQWEQFTQYLSPYEPLLRNFLATRFSPISCFLEMTSKICSCRCSGSLLNTQRSATAFS